MRLDRLAARLVLLFPLVLAFSSTAAHAQGYGSFVSPGPLAQPHAELDTLTGCTSCHAPGRGPTPDRCMACHDSVKRQVRTQSGFHGRKNRGQQCGTCHADHLGRENQLILIPDDFSHLEETGWGLEGEHALLDCRQCHQTPGDYSGQRTECISCHERDDVHGHDKSKRSLLSECEACHDADGWSALPLPVGVFDHDDARQADYPLEYAHSNVECAECHIDFKFVPVAFQQCDDCHINSHRAPFREQPCEDCHATAETFVVPTFDHNLTGYRIEGEHVGVECEECHKSGDKTDEIPEVCSGCHDDVHRGQFRPRECDACHSVSVPDWSMAGYDHDRSRYPLEGKHNDVGCEECHGTGPKARYANLKFEDCDACHQDAHGGRHEPVPCARCHIAEGFEVQYFDHDTTDFPHTGKHVGLACEKCHQEGKWDDVPHASCNDCHYPTNPHDETVTSDSCDSCHQTTGFASVVYDHLVNTGFDLAPAHSAQPCNTCHEGASHFAGLESECEVCHESDRPKVHYEGRCLTCHQAEKWFPGSLGGGDHGAMTGFDLEGAHELLPCASCHREGRPRGEASPTCGSCHAAEDVHNNQLGMACADCHNTVSWLRTSFRHHQTGWPLRGAHRLATCYDCHALSYVGTPTQCFRCHEVEAPLSIPEHLGPNFQNCDGCHRVYQWSPALAYPH
ncbi:MAG: cytochrome c3 family protein [Myxococcota bacterium]